MLPELLALVLLAVLLAVVGYVVWRVRGDPEDAPAGPREPPPDPDYVAPFAPAYAPLYDRLAAIHADPTEPAHWVHRAEDGTVKTLPVPERHMRAMLRRWRREHGGRIGLWWGAYRDRVQMHADTRAWLEARILDPARFPEEV